MDVCVCLSGADGRGMEGRATLFRHHREVSRVRIPGQMGLPWMLCVVVFVMCRPEKGKYPGAPPHHRKNEKNQPIVKVPDRPSGERGKAKKRKSTIPVCRELVHLKGKPLGKLLSLDRNGILAASVCNILLFMKTIQVDLEVKENGSGT
jgi:hypothetical protein